MNFLLSASAPTFSFKDLGVAAFRIFMALIVGTIIGMERGRQGRAAGMRTHILVCLGATLTSMTGMYAFEVLNFGNDPLRIAAQVISGIGFLGVGTILIKGRFQITGLTTAAGIWCAATIGIALGIGYYEGALVTFLASVIAVTMMHRFEYKVTRRHTRFGMYVEITSADHVRNIINHLTENYPSTDIQVTPPRSGTAGSVGIEVNIHPSAKHPYTPNSIAEDLEKLDEVIFALESI
ncbi:MAG: MgtC/SapB family protein [Clostridia bacterium]|nr:MgtC/SapB family protein [Clostridia bacterium]